MLGASLNAAVGRGAILLGLLVCLFGIGITIAGIRQNNLKALRSSAYYAYAAFGAALLAFVIMERAIITRDFSLAYVQKRLGTQKEPKDEHGKVAGYFNLDNGTGRIRGVYLQGNEAVARPFRRWLVPFHAHGASTLTLDDTGGTDHLAFHAVGVPGFQFLQDPVSYSTRTHHSNMDVWDHAVADDLKQASVVMAAFVWQTAQRDAQLPRHVPPPPRRPRSEGAPAIR